MSENVKRETHYKQVCVWPGTVVNDGKVDEFTKFMKDKFKVRVQYLEQILTGPDREDGGYPVEGTGGRNDLFFAVHCADVGGFAVARLTVGIKWVEDVLNNEEGKASLYPKRITEYRTW